MDPARLLVVGACALASFLVCGIPFGLIIAARMSGIDVRKVGSGNIGMTNVARSAGAKAALLTFLCDAGKGTLCVVASRHVIASLGVAEPLGMVPGVIDDWMPAVVFCACVLGHIFSPYLGFKGGKGISVGFGAGLGLWWPVGIGMLVVFLACTVPTRYVSLGSVVAAASLPVQCALWHMTPPALASVSVIAAVVIWSHRENIARLIRGEERRFSIRDEKGNR